MTLLELIECLQEQVEDNPKSTKMHVFFVTSDQSEYELLSVYDEGKKVYIDIEMTKESYIKKVRKEYSISRPTHGW